MELYETQENCYPETSDYLHYLTIYIQARIQHVAYKYTIYKAEQQTLHRFTSGIQ